ncbi:MAG: hypothetical protein ABSG93_06075 [Solirubrobacteraceae bacterium]
MRYRQSLRQRRHGRSRAGVLVAGFAAFKNHLSCLPFSGSVLSQPADELDGYAMTMTEGVARSDLGSCRSDESLGAITKP